MPTEEEIGKKLVEAVWINKKHGDVFFGKLQKQLNKLNVKTTKEATKLYNKVLSSLDLKDKLVENSVDNLSKVKVLMGGIDSIQRIYRKQYSELARGAKKESRELLKNRESKVTELLSKVDIVEQDRSLVTKENFKLMEMINTQGYKRINQTLEKWKNFTYDTFYVGVTRGMNIAEFKDLFYTDAGSLKIGSSLVQESEMETMISITEQRTAFLRQRAKELSYKCCWNSNPMDMRTKPECISASLDGVITEAAMGTDHGFPPRYICRCELVYTRCEWTRINKGVNGAIADRRFQLLNELESAPNQMAKWKRGEAWIIPKEELRAAGLKPYKEIEDKIKLIEGKEVPRFKVIKKPPESAQEILEQYEKSAKVITETKKTEEELKKAVAERLGKKMYALKSGDMDDFVRFINNSTVVRETEFGDYRYTIQKLIEQWATTSGDNNPRAIAMQLAARKEFGLEATSLWWNKKAVEAGTKCFKKYEIPMRRFLRDMYNDTQDYLKKEGLKTVRVVRGYKGNTGIEASTLRKKMEKVDAQLQPMSSFSSNFEEAIVFANPGSEGAAALFYAEIPANKVLSCPLTGYGCLREVEWVILGTQKAKVDKLFSSKILGWDMEPHMSWEKLFGSGQHFEEGVAEAIHKLTEK